MVHQSSRLLFLQLPPPSEVPRSHSGSNARPAAAAAATPTPAAKSLRCSSTAPTPTESSGRRRRREAQWRSPGERWRRRARNWVPPWRRARRRRWRWTSWGRSRSRRGLGRNIHWLRRPTRRWRHPRVRCHCDPESRSSIGIRPLFSVCACSFGAAARNRSWESCKLSKPPQENNHELAHEITNISRGPPVWDSNQPPPPLQVPTVCFLLPPEGRW